jgi:NADH-quinone oxidoreductase subunit N
MMFEVANMSFALPEMFMLAMSGVILMAVAFMGRQGANAAYILSQVTMIGTAVLLYQAIDGSGGLTFNGSYIKDTLSDVLKLAICIVNVAVLLYSNAYLKARDLFKGEYYVLAVFATLGMMIITCAEFV